MKITAFVGYSESELKDFKFGNTSIDFCRKDEYPDPTEFFLKNATRLGITGEQCVEGIINKVILKNVMFKDFELKPTHNIAHSGDYLFMNKSLNVCFMLECKNKQTISYKEDLQKFDSDLENIKLIHKMNTIGVFLQLGGDKITRHESIEINNDTVYLTRDYINRSCLELVFSYYMRKINTEEVKLMCNTFAQSIINDMTNMEKVNNSEMNVLNKVISRAEHNIRSIGKVILSLNSQNAVIKKIIETCERSMKTNEDSDSSMDSLNSIDNDNEPKQESDDDIFNMPMQNDAKSCIVQDTKAATKNKLFSKMYSDKIKMKDITKDVMKNKYKEFTTFINTNTMKSIKDDYRIYVNKKNNK